MKLKSIVSYVVLGVTNSDGNLLKDANLGLNIISKNGALIGLPDCLEFLLIDIDNRKIYDDSLGQAIVLNTITGELLYLDSDGLSQLYRGTKGYKIVFGFAEGYRFGMKNVDNIIPVMTAWKFNPKEMLWLEISFVEDKDGTFHRYIRIDCGSYNYKLYFLENEGLKKCQRYFEEIPCNFIDLLKLAKALPIDMKGTKYKLLGKRSFYGIYTYKGSEFIDKIAMFSERFPFYERLELKKQIENDAGLKINSIDNSYIRVGEKVFNTSIIYFKPFLKEYQKSGSLSDVLENLAEYLEQYPLKIRKV